MDLPGTHVPKVESRTGRPTAKFIAACDLCAEPMNETAMKQLRAPSKNQTETSHKYSSGSIYLRGSLGDYASHNPM